MKNTPDPAIVFRLIVFLMDRMLFTVKKMKDSWFLLLLPLRKIRIRPSSGPLQCLCL